MPAPGCGLPGRATSAHHAWSSVATHPTRPMIARRPLVYPSTLLQSPSRHVRPPDVHAHLGWPRACSPSKTAKVISSKATVLGQVLFCNIATQDLTPAGHAMRPCREHRRAVCAFSARPPHHEPPPAPACRDARRRQHRPRGQVSSAGSARPPGQVLFCNIAMQDLTPTPGAFLSNWRRPLSRRNLSLQFDPDDQ